MTPLPTLRQLRYLVALADHRHFGHAAEECLVTQSTLSAGLQELETLLGAPLVERTRRSVMVTSLGDEVAERARRLLRDARDLVDTVRAADAPLSGPLRLGVIPTVAPYLLPRLLPSLRQAYPQLRLILREDLSARLMEALKAGELDVLLLALPWPADGVTFLPLGDDPFLLAVPPGHALAGDGPFDIADLPSDQLLLLEEGHCLRDHALAACRLAPHHDHGLTGTSLHTVVQMVAGGLGITLLPQMAVESGALAGSGLVVRPLTGGDGAPTRGIGLAWRAASARATDFRLLGAALARSMG